jgi:hypothetical protein
MAQPIFYKTLFSSVRECYEQDSYCDVKLFACTEPEEGPENNVDETDEYPNPANMHSIQCHSLVLCAVAPTFKVIDIIKLTRIQILLLPLFLLFLF